MMRPDNVKSTVRIMKIVALLMVVCTLLITVGVLAVVWGDFYRPGYTLESIWQYMGDTFLTIGAGTVTGLFTALMIYASALMLDLMLSIHAGIHVSDKVLRNMYRDQLTVQPHDGTP